jgi:hypothetical protein
MRDGSFTDEVDLATTIRKSDELDDDVNIGWVDAATAKNFDFGYRTSLGTTRDICCGKRPKCMSRITEGSTYSDGMSTHRGKQVIIVAIIITIIVIGEPTTNARSAGLRRACRLAGSW